jgi:hypothetical protein
MAAHLLSEVAAGLGIPAQERRPMVGEQDLDGRHLHPP